MKTFFTFLFSNLLTITLMYAQQSPEKVAQQSADVWLKGVDSGKYTESWSEASAFFQKAVSQEQWDKALQSVRKPLGKLTQRTSSSAKYSKNLPGAPAGDYVVVEYKTSFEKMAVATENITLMREKDGQWKVAGYFIK